MDEKFVRAGCGVLLLDNGKILLGLRNSNEKEADCDLHEEGTWTMPGGEIEFGETIEEAAIRETFEETGLILNDPKVICVQNDKNEHAHFVSLGLVATKYSGEITIKEPKEIIKWEWFPLDNLPKNLFSPARKTVECYLNNKFYMD